MKRKKQRKVAIFDIDGTIFRSSLLIEITEAMVQEGILPWKVRNLYAEAYKRWRERKGPYDDYIAGVVAAFDVNIECVKYKDFHRVAKKVVSFYKNRVYIFTRDLVKNLRRRGYFLLAISNSPKDVLDEFCKELGFNKVYGRIYEIDKKGKLTGETQYLDLIRDKSKIVERAIEKENLTLRGSYGVGDTESDVPFLKMVSKPYCFNPNRRLHDYARRVGWEIVVERKDVIYSVK
mgnify:FL=1